MKCALWLNKTKVFKACDIPENFDAAALRGYFLAGSLVPWLRENGGEAYAKRLERVSENAPDLNKQLLDILGKPEQAAISNACIKSAVFSSGGAPLAAVPTTLYFGSGGALGSFTFKSGSFSGSYRFGSFSTGSGYSTWEWEWFFRRSGSGGMTSYKGFGSGGYHEWEWEWFFGRRGSFTSFGSGAKGLGSFELESFGGIDFGAGFTFGSFAAPAYGSFGMLTADEYDMIMYATLAGCPLDRFGYGIHNI